jgi:hypothetical protein
VHHTDDNTRKFIAESGSGLRGQGRGGFKP